MHINKQRNKQNTCARALTICKTRSRDVCLLDKHLQQYTCWKTVPTARAYFLQEIHTTDGNTPGRQSLKLLTSLNSGITPQQPSTTGRSSPIPREATRKQTRPGKKNTGQVPGQSRCELGGTASRARANVPAHCHTAVSGCLFSNLHKQLASLIDLHCPHCGYRHKLSARMT